MRQPPRMAWLKAWAEGLHPGINKDVLTEAVEELLWLQARNKELSEAANEAMLLLDRHQLHATRAWQLLTAAITNNEGRPA